MTVVHEDQAKTYHLYRVNFSESSCHIWNEQSKVVSNSLIRLVMSLSRYVCLTVKRNVDTPLHGYRSICFVRLTQYKLPKSIGLRRDVTWYSPSNLRPLTEPAQYTWHAGCYVAHRRRNPHPLKHYLWIYCCGRVRHCAVWSGSARRWAVLCQNTTPCADVFGDR